jgi:hypothetical protein
LFTSTLQAFGWLKKYLRRHVSQYNGADADKDCVRAGLSALPQHKVAAFFKHSGYLIEQEGTDVEPLMTILSLLALMEVDAET